MTGSERIPARDVAFHPHSFADPAGRLFHWEGQLYRALAPSWAPLGRRLLRDGTIQQLVGRGLLIGTDPTALALDGYAMVVRHRQLPFVSYPEEWCFGMLQAAALAIIDLAAALVPLGLTLKDAHPWNVLFAAGRPVYVDLTSIVAADAGGGWSAVEEFRRYCLRPLLLMAWGQERVARALLPTYGGVSAAEVRALTPAALVAHPSAALGPTLRHLATIARGRVLGSPVAPPTRTAMLAALRHEVARLGPPARAMVPGVAEDAVARAVGERALHTTVAQHHPRTVLVIGATNDPGAYARSAATHGGDVVAIDRDSVRVERLYRAARATPVSLLPLVMDLADPTPPRGLARHLAIAAADRLACDLVVVPDLTGLARERHLTGHQLAVGLAQFTRRWLLVEAPGDEGGEVVHGFASALRRQFPAVTPVGPPHAGRGWLFCEK